MATKTDYFQKLKDPRWQRRRLEIMQRDEFTCQQCFDSESTLNVHHRVYVKGKEPWEYPDATLVTLCEDCHKDEGMVSQAIHDFLITLWPRYAFNQDTTRFGNLADFIKLGLQGSYVRAPDQEEWMACVGAVCAIFVDDAEGHEDLKQGLLSVFRDLAAKQGQAV